MRTGVTHRVIEPVHAGAQLVDEGVVRPLEVAARPGLGDGRRLAINRHPADRAWWQPRIFRVLRRRRHLLIMRSSAELGYCRGARAQICQHRDSEATFAFWPSARQVLHGRTTDLHAVTTDTRNEETGMMRPD